MTPGKYNLVIYKGDSYKWRFSLWADAARTQPVDLTGSVAKAEIRDRSGGVVLGAMDCVVELPNFINATLTADVTKALKAGVWDLQITTGLEVKTVLAGSVAITPDVTDSTGVMRSA